MDVTTLDLHEKNRAKRKQRLYHKMEARIKFIFLKCLSRSPTYCLRLDRKCCSEIKTFSLHESQTLEDEVERITVPNFKPTLLPNFWGPDCALPSPGIY